jgi:predicted transcriptional regulator
MNRENHILTLVADDSSQLHLHADAAGLDLLIRNLERLRSKIAQGECDHDHMMTESWGDGALTESMGCEEEGQVINHLKIYGWTDEWAKNHGFKD